MEQLIYAIKNIEKCSIMPDEIIIDGKFYKRNIPVHLKTKLKRTYTLCEILFYILNKRSTSAEYLRSCNKNNISPIDYTDRKLLNDEINSYCSFDESNSVLDEIESRYICNKDFSYIFDILKNLENKKEEKIVLIDTFRIIVPSSVKSLITVNNVKDFLEKSKFLESNLEDIFCSSSKCTVSIDGVQFDVYDDVKSFTSEDWKSVVAIFVDGSSWQFKNWKDKNLAEIFCNTAVFFVRYDNMEMASEIQGYNIENVVVDKKNKSLKKEDFERIRKDILKVVELKRRL
ncbi:putative RNA polymerase II protein [Hamiltosporidium magnivora]|uniref:Putative RNA polymerase II protein n=1 Tax=Hamiltosporidium magnivora TaxID=148818 RepID=A0A4Q9L826_9MICR|nr:putative RNA polymerase II protein [Hamiltosporidium magnivora]